QRFQVILFRDAPGGPGFEVFGGPQARLVPATVANNAALSRWLAPIRRPAGDRAAGAWARVPDETLAGLAPLHPRRAESRRVVIQAIQFVEEDPTGTMQRIGTEHGDGPGSYRVLTLEELVAQ